MPHEFPTSPWVKVAIDFYFNGKNYVEVVDYYSKFIEVQLISSLQATVVIPAIKSIFARHGSEEYSTSDAIPESIPTVRPQEPLDEPASDFQSSKESSSYEPISRSPDKGP
ncbi:hypothetical protein AVEN_45321-1 [Araneus ventricosus]|uniref:Uncharacterized protein n=1 Tax=Araneus ventricosus TaxID=182803 RepID=A0A4Y2WGI2_ARAVE|nr:hypothetical protein AVEN_45321-1 [Araneus ventricosus]